MSRNALAELGNSKEKEGTREKVIADEINQRIIIEPLTHADLDRQGSGASLRVLAGKQDTKITVEEIRELQGLNEDEPMTLGRTLALLKERKMQIVAENKLRQKQLKELQSQSTQRLKDIAEQRRGSQQAVLARAATLKKKQELLNGADVLNKDDYPTAFEEIQEEDSDNSELDGDLTGDKASKGSKSSKGSFYSTFL